MSQFRVCILWRTRPLWSRRRVLQRDLVNLINLWSISWLRHQMFYPYVTISAAQAHEGDDLHHATSPFSLFLSSFPAAFCCQSVSRLARWSKQADVPLHRHPSCLLHLTSPETLQLWQAAGVFTSCLFLQTDRKKNSTPLSTWQSLKSQLGKNNMLMTGEQLSACSQLSSCVTSPWWFWWSWWSSSTTRRREGSVLATGCCIVLQLWSLNSYMSFFYLCFWPNVVNQTLLPDS